MKFFIFLSFLQRGDFQTGGRAGDRRECLPYYWQIAQGNLKIAQQLSCALFHLVGRLVGDAEDGVAEPFFEEWIVAELFEELCVVRQQLHHDATQRPVVFDTGVLFIGIFYRVLVRGIGGDFFRYFFSDDGSNFIPVFPVDVAKQVVEGFDDSAQPVQFRLRFSASACCGNRARVRFMLA